ncbi:MAG: hypothetical protein FWG73_05360 [Planctomycetaceae bacterium]|nr:hypothetical protein [Planctomycetaceae bacterium]
MAGIHEVDSLLHQVRRTARQFRFSEDAAISQQILLFGDCFYGYRFVATEFTAVWSAVEQTFKLFDHTNQLLGVFPALELAVESTGDMISATTQRKVA